MQDAASSAVPRPLPRALRDPEPVGRERAVADRVGAPPHELGLEWDEDDAGGSARRRHREHLLPACPPTNGGGTPIFLCAHTDTVPPETAIEPVVGEDGIVRNAAGTILGSDNKAAVVVMLEAVRRVLEEEREHAGIELLFTPQEEVSLRGADAFDHTRFVATDRLRLRPGRADRRDRPRLAARAAARLPLPRRGRACRDAARRTGARRSRQRRAPSQTSASGASTRRRARTSA